MEAVYTESKRISSNPATVASTAALYVDKQGRVCGCRVEAAIMNGIGIHIIGLADRDIKDTLLRVVTALQSLGYGLPGKKIVISLIPMDLVKSGDGFDLAIAVAILLASGQVRSFYTDGVFFSAKLGLDGSLIPLGREDELLARAPMDHILVGASPDSPEHCPDMYMGFNSLADFIQYAENNWARPQKI